MAEDIDKSANQIVEDFRKGAPNHDFTDLINHVQDMSKSQNFAQILDKANKALDAAFPDQFGNVDIVGAHDGMLRIKNVTTKQEADVPAKATADNTQAANRSTDNTSNQGQKQVKDNADGSSVEFTKQVDGRMHATKVTHPDGTYTEYTYDKNGKDPVSVTEYNKDGKAEHKYECTDGYNWKPTLNASDPPFAGKLVVGDDGSHIFMSPGLGAVTRRPDGSMQFRDAMGNVTKETEAIPNSRPHDATNTPQNGDGNRPAGGGGGQPSGAETFSPRNEAYSPVGPPGLGECKKGEEFFWEKAGGKGLYDIDNRSQTSTETNPADKSVTYRYKGEVDDGYITDTNFEASERYSQDGKLLDRHIKYDGGVDMSFQTPDGKKKIDNVNEVDASFDAASGNYISTITTKDGTKYRAITGADGNVKSFDQITGDTQADTQGVVNAQVGNFAPKDGVYNPVRPWGIGEMTPGEASSSDKDKGVDWRTSKSEKNLDGSTTYNYEGEVEDSTWYWWGDTNYKGSETVDSKGNLLRSTIKYDDAIDQKFQGPNGQKVELHNVQEVETHRTANGGFETTVTTKDGVHKFTTGPDGKVTDFT